MGACPRPGTLQAQRKHRPSLFPTRPQLDAPSSGASALRLLAHHRPLKGQQPRTPELEGILPVFRGWAELVTVVSVRPGCPGAEPRLSPPSMKAQNSGREWTCRGGWGGLPGPGPVAWQVDESSTLDPWGGGTRQVCGKDTRSWILVLVAVVVGAAGGGMWVCRD